MIHKSRPWSWPLACVQVAAEIEQKKQSITMKKTKYTCLILRNRILSGDKYMLCSFSEEHVHNYNALQNYLRTTRKPKATCQYCKHPMKEEIYQQP
jgi:DNA-directed RNA polymerase subunit L